MSNTPIPLFPLSAHLLPEGRMALRIFEPRYMRMVKQACAENKGFVMCMLNASGDKSVNEHIYPIGTYAKVVDFDLLDDGLLGIKVAGLHLVEVTDVAVESDGLRTGQCHTVAPWNCEISPQQLAPIDDRLKEIFENYTEIASLYEETRFDDPLWVLRRWLELLPVDGGQKQQFLTEGGGKKLLNYLCALVR
ncbi:LON peptidase substrate-binding domain-containing protein [Alteromonas sp. 1_MG-2023]|uniref:LON peptidase substrate-binding domain-containing protein n=1 Tax=Alteromonas sp. 1_MG-2023 TaxID=3062669 RepID=UPI0026E1AEEB|nr:LON peptidase substrate-binding domain-containing protein [Alteromonas sp. 1_MG-2023]MDO6566153.1 LON peptidase substrate-binding domain-containing protein [Alteromonas sp. 1_MG-2023]